MNSLVKLECNQGCGQEFLLISIGAEVVRDDIWKHGFRCPHCGKEYIAYYTNEGIRRMQELQKQLQAKPTKKNKKLIKDLAKRIEAGMERLKEEMEHAKS